MRDDPELWEAAKAKARELLGGHSARAMQLAGQLYRAAGGGYRGRKSAAQRSLTTWTKQDWTTKSGKRSRDTGERYLPRRVLEQLSPQEYAATTSAKRKGTAQGKQFVAQPAKIRAKVARLKHKDNPMARTPTPAQLAARERFAEMARSGAFKKKAAAARKSKANPVRKKASMPLSPEKTVYKRYSIISPASSNTVYIVRDGTNVGSARNIAEAKSIIDMLTEGLPNPASKTVSQNEIKMKIRGSETPDNPEGIVVTEAGALRFAKQNMPADLKRAGFVASVVPGSRGWSINYGMKVPGHSSYQNNPHATNPRKPTYRRTPYVAPDPDLAFTRAYDLLNNLDFEDVYYRERRISAAKGVRLNAALDRILDAMERLAKNMKP